MNFQYSWEVYRKEEEEAVLVEMYRILISSFDNISAGFITSLNSGFCRSHGEAEAASTMSRILLTFDELIEWHLIVHVK